MNWSAQKRQQISFLILLGVVAILTTWAYHMIKREFILFRKAETHFFAKEFSKAIPFYVLSIKAGLKLPNALSHLGDSYLATQNFKEAVQVYEKIAQTDSHNLAAIKKLAALYEQFGRVDDAIALYRRYESSLPLNDALIHLADLYKRKEAFHVAEKLYLKVLEQTPGSLSAQLKLAEMLGWIRRYEEAIARCRSVLQAYPNHRLARIYLARVLSWSGQFDEAIKEYKKVLEEPP